MSMNTPLLTPKNGKIGALGKTPAIITLYSLYTRARYGLKFT